ncbi:MAG: DUF4974 domain-containing protein [Parapedobacter sp.]|nr:MAG: DUF4974 domain-containing protein [Parapedobacter sp.]
MEHSNTYQRYYELAEKWQNGTITAEEMAELEHWFAQHPDNPVEIPSSFAADEKQHAQRMLAAIRARTTRQTKVRVMNGWTRVAAVIAVVLIGVWGWYLLTENTSDTQVAQVRQQPLNDALPAQFRAKLTLADGREIILDSVAFGELAKQGDTRIINQEGRLHYDGQFPDGGTELMYNTITTARGETYALTLSDGSRIWLNASSSIRFPVAFGADQRKVEITGEGYFEVATDVSRKFIVAAGGTETEVLGTHFNINSYEDEADVKVSLLEGKVKINRSAVLLPGQQARIVGENIEVVRQANMEQAVAWKNGLFNFDRSDLKTVMRQLSRWYDLDVEYPARLPQEHFSGNMSRGMNASNVLQVLEYSGVKFHIEGRKIVVHP